MRTLPVVAGSLIAVAGCAAPMPETSEPMEATTHSIVGGSPSSSAQDATVLVNEAGSATCTGVLVAPNLVLTARHCVTYYNASSECGAPLGADVATSLITVSVGIYASPHSPVARATRFFVPTAQDLCSSDIALIALDNDVKGITPAIVRFSPPVMNEVTTAIGYGTQGSGRRQRTDVKVLAVGPTTASYRTFTGQDLSMNVPPNEIVTTESTCYGDSGGPLVDSLGQIVAVASRGLDDLCVDRPTFWTTFAAHEQLIRSAASSVGHPLAEATTPPPRGGTTNAASGSPGSTAGSADDEADDGADEPTGTRPRKSGAAVASAGCSSSTGRAWGFDGIALALALGLVCRSRRRRF